MIFLLYFSIIFLLITSVVLLRNLFEFRALKSISPIPEEDAPFVSICIPARNEEAVIERCVTSALKQDYPTFEVLVLDDNSTDETSEILRQLSGIITNLKHLKGTPKPEDWLGKPWACHQLSKAAKGQIMVFIDADVWLDPDVLSKTVARLRHKDAITVWPQQQLKSFWENMIIPMILFALYTLLPAIYVERSPGWMPSFISSRFDEKFAAACGQFLAFRRSTYDQIGGHEAVKNNVVEDMELARNLKSSGFLLQMVHGVDAVYCRMYSSHSEIWDGFKKNFLAGFGNLFEFILMGILHLIIFILPFFTVAIGVFENEPLIITLSTIAISLILLQRITLSILFRWNIFYSFLHPISVFWFQILGLISILNKALGIKTSWKGREV
ncbi:MAG: glycosyltransferase [Balneolaceae bacterium]|nr:glycosyltransferase [Balneolaceae bacterium]MBO6546305.1 glycosyltransferase [Balneolaceae bacterium]MBO6648664.1 glycosyltransferase [Balneolaceae bacterium]